MAYSPWQRVPESLRTRNCHYVLWRYQATILSANIHIFCWLPWEVWICLWLTSCTSSDHFSPVYIRILIASIRNLGICPCPQCTTPMTHVPEMGTPNDMKQRQLLVRTDNDSRWNKVLQARELIYERNYAVNTPQIERSLRDQSLVPTAVSEDSLNSTLIWCTNTIVKNTFSDKLSALGFNLFMMLVVDLLHEFELGVWKAIFTHLLRMLDSLTNGKLHELDHRYVHSHVSFQGQVTQ